VRPSKGDLTGKGRCNDDDDDDDDDANRSTQRVGLADLVVDRRRANAGTRVRNDVSRCMDSDVVQTFVVITRPTPPRARGGPFPFVTSLATCKRSYWAISSAVKGPVCNLVTIKN